MALAGACEALLAGTRFDANDRLVLAAAARDAGGVWQKLPFDLEAFLYDGKPWPLTCAELEPARRPFELSGAGAAFERLWALALTNEPDPQAFAAVAMDDCAHRAALAFDELRACLDDGARKAAAALRAIEREIRMHDGSPALISAYKKLLRGAAASVHARPASRAQAVEKIAGDCEKLFDEYSADHSNDAWWACGRLFLAEVFARHVQTGDTEALAARPGLLARMMTAPEAALWRARVTASAEPLRAVHFQQAADGWLDTLEQRIDPLTLGFEDRIRYEIARLKLLHARVDSMEPAAGPTRELLTAFDGLRALLAHGVPPASRAVPDSLEPALVDFYVDAAEGLHGASAFATTCALRERHPEDFRLACLYATHVLERGDSKKLDVLGSRAPRARFDAELFARCASSWSSLPNGGRLCGRVRPLLFDVLDREQRKQCLIELSRLALRRAATRDVYRDALRGVLPFFERDGFVFRELRDGAALESALVFLATMLAPLHGVELELNESQSQQWVSHAEELARQSAFGARLVADLLQAPPSRRGFALSPAVHAAARARSPSVRQSAAAAAGGAKRKKRKRSGRSASSEAGPSPNAPSPRQEGLFDAFDP